MSKFVELKPPTWSAVLPMLLAVLENSNEAGRKVAREELARMAKIADVYVAEQDQERAA